MRIAPAEKLGNRQQIKAFYDRLGRWLDTQRFFKEPALKSLLEYSDFESASYVCELGCGTGRLAAKILSRNRRIVYRGVDLSSTMLANPFRVMVLLDVTNWTASQRIVCAEMEGY